MLCYSWKNSQEQKFSADIPPQKNFKGYELLTLKTKLYPFVHREFGKNKEIRFVTSNTGFVHQILLNLYVGAEVYDLTMTQKKKLQNQIDKIIAQTPAEFACVFSYQHNLSYQTGHPSVSWIQSVLKYIDLDDKEFVNRFGVGGAVWRRPAGQFSGAGLNTLVPPGIGPVPPEPEVSIPSNEVGS